MIDSHSPSPPAVERRGGAWLVVPALLIGGLGVFMLAGGAWLAWLGGSLYYLLAGALMVASAVLLLRRRAAALHVFAVLVVGTIVWAISEIGFDWWQLVPRGDLIFLLGALLLLPPVVRRLSPRGWRPAAAPLAVALVAAALVALVTAFHRDHDRPGRLDMAATAAPAPASGDWAAYAGTWAGQKYAPWSQITPGNVDKLALAWHVHTGDRKRPSDPGETTYEVTPIKVGDTVFLCTPHDLVLALDAETGQRRWTFDPRIEVTQHMQHLTCRGVSYLATPGAGSDCARRVFVATNDARLIAIDAASGRRCAGFGRGGDVDLRRGMEVGPHGWYQGTSAPLVARGLVIVGGAVYDNIATHVPAGVIRAYDARDGHLVWNFDPARPDATAPLPAGQRYTPSTPNMWSTAAADEALGLAYFPMGMGAVDQWGGHRPAWTERFATTVLALDLATGRPRWAFQTVHHDLWDMDVPAQPALVDLDLPGRGRVPALVQSTKTGNIFVLDRRTGRPLLPVTERRVPGGAAPGDRTAPTQPFSAASLMAERPIAERDMWGGTMLDQLACRIKFRRLRYEGPFTPPSLQGTLVFPGNFGVMDWGGLAIDPVRQIAFAHPNYMAFVDRLVPRRDSNIPGVGPSGGSDMHGSSEHGYNPNKGAPFAVELNPFLSVLGLPCQAPPWGYVAGLDLRTGKVAWRHANGTIRDETPLPLPFKMGVPSLGGPMTTAGGVAFLSSAIDDYIRAYDVRDGRVLWRARLPAGGQATPMSYISPRSGRQFVVVVAGGHGSLGTRLGDSVLAYALPK
ncbi:membrane-bound PQQ-dependent dehydrogenase, glucose/quinate/shikimate family [Sphingomonas sp. BK580]|uniref:membrane-bound PQQ-dependent dehydrogenase, glucose/quinate/shikimate family n=1 Tax=Sphingomonas sp. BK580 TaxID=2586972 RepID=UPI0016116B34|nr:membrane-bound PQQ-dependent dehydrogenase, glucose/quinate/shikimate family [Sphingomonas sp. BK580]MBB3695721.1 quinoprotein glucose dehydrogenase [Sphingomonas sp. BK580]